MRKVLISLAAATAIFFAGCADEKKEETAYVETKTPKVMTQEQKSDLIDKAQEEVSKATQQVKQSSSEVVEKVKDSVTPIAKNIEEEIALKAEAVENEVSNAAKKVSKDIEQKVQTVTKAIASSSANGSELYKKCSACHGQKGEKKALGASEAIKGWDVQRTIDSLKGYQNKTYGGKMKTIMTGQVATLSDDDIEALAKHIAQF